MENTSTVTCNSYPLIYFLKAQVILHRVSSQPHLRKFSATQLNNDRYLIPLLLSVGNILNNDKSCYRLSASTSFPSVFEKVFHIDSPLTAL
jgi:hypothetical protein